MSSSEIGGTLIRAFQGSQGYRDTPVLRTTDLSGKKVGFCSDFENKML